jgi:peptidoglycan/LPS O-acetylase OafA/YrhL
MTSSGQASISNYIKSFDGIRGICCLSVLLVHYQFHGFNLPASVVYIGLHCFFIMSAFLITKNLLRDKERSNDFWHCFRIFYIKRTARIFPLYFFYLLLVVALYVLFLKLFQFDIGLENDLKQYGYMLLTFTYNLKSTVLLLQGHTGIPFDNLAFPHLWSLSLEEQFYIVVIFMAWFGNKKFLQICTVFFILVMPVIRIIGYHWIGSISNDDWLRTLVMWHSPLFQFDAFFYGIALTVFDFKKTKLYLYLLLLTFILIAGFGLYNALMCASQFNVPFFETLREDKYFYNNGGYLFMDSLVNLFCALWFLSVIYFPEKFKLLTSSFAVKLGEVTYGLYIFQFLFIPVGMVIAGILIKFGIPALAADAVGVSSYVALNYAFSRWVYNRVEMPVVHWKDKVLKRVYAEK